MVISQSYLFLLVTGMPLRSSCPSSRSPEILWSAWCRRIMCPAFFSVEPKGGAMSGKQGIESTWVWEVWCISLFSIYICWSNLLYIYIYVLIPHIYILCFIRYKYIYIYTTLYILIYNINYTIYIYIFVLVWTMYIGVSFRKKFHARSLRSDLQKW